MRYLVPGDTRRERIVGWRPRLRLSAHSWLSRKTGAIFCDEIKRHAALILAERLRLFATLSELPGVTPFRSFSNFVLARFPDALAVYEGLKARGILVKNVSAQHSLMANTLRISVGTPNEMHQLLAALKALVM